MAHKSTCVAALFWLGCSASSNTNGTQPDAANPPPTPDAPVDAYVVPGAHYQYIIDRMDVPENPGQFTMWGLDFDGQNGVNNKLGTMIEMLANAGFMVATPETAAVNKGSTLVLIDLVTTDFTTAPVAGVQILKGADPMPAPCSPGGDVGGSCRHQFDGTGHFSVAASNPQFTGAIDSGVLTTTAGDFALQLSLGVDPLLDLPITDAHLQIKAASATALGTEEAAKAGAIISGAIRATDMTAFLTQLQLAGAALITRDCPGPTTSVTQDCGCTAASGGYAMINFFDADHNCKVTLDEIQNNTMLTALLAPDVTLPDASMAVSVGFGFHAVNATFTLP